MGKAQTQTQAPEQSSPSPRTLEDVAIECKSVTLHNAITIPGWFTESLFTATKHPGLKMYWLPGAKIDGVVLKYKGGSRIIPKALVQIISPLVDL